MPKNRTFRETEIESIIGIIRAWPKERITWSDLCARTEPLLGFMPSRQGLYQREEIRNAFQAKQKGLRISPKTAAPMPSSLAVASMRISNLNAQIREKDLIINRMRDQFIRWQYNAYLGGISEADLEKPLPGVDREVQQPANKEEKRRK
jgi:hypothetical protein